MLKQACYVIINMVLCIQKNIIIYIYMCVCFQSGKNMWLTSLLLIHSIYITLCQ